jgi:hypothetical protein
MYPGMAFQGVRKVSNIAESNMRHLSYNFTVIVIPTQS